MIKILHVNFYFARWPLSHAGVNVLGSYRDMPFVTGREGPSRIGRQDAFTTEILDYKNGNWIHAEDYPRRYLDPNSDRYVENSFSLFRASKLLNENDLRFNPYLGHFGDVA